MPVNVPYYLANPSTVSLGNFNGGAFVPAIAAGPHRIYTAANCRVNLNPTVNHGVGIEGITSLDPQAAPGGDTYFLPFATNEICSLVLPAPGGVGNPTGFLTTNLSGCKVFVDTIPAVPGSIVVYHANNEANAPPRPFSGQIPTLELLPCTQELSRLHTQARANLAGAPYNLVLGAVGAGASVAKPTYNAGAMVEVNRKLGQNRTHVEFTGGTMVFGVVNGAAWELYWATYGSCEYDRPGIAPKGWFGHGHRSPTQSNAPNYRVLGSARFY